MTMWHRVMCCTNCARLHAVQSKGIIAPLAYCCIMRPNWLDDNYTVKNGARVEVKSAHETRSLWRLQNTLPLFKPLAATTFRAMWRDYHVYVVLLAVLLQECRSDSCLRRFCHATRWNSEWWEQCRLSMWNQGWMFFCTEIYDAEFLSN